MTNERVDYRIPLLPSQQLFTQFLWLSGDDGELPPGAFSPELNGLFGGMGAIPLPPDLAADTIEQALALLATHHPGLRTRFTPGKAAGEPPVVQEAAGTYPDFKAVERLGSVPAGPRVRAFFADEIAAGFDDGRLVRFRLLRLAPDDQRLVVVTSHAIFDGWSIVALGLQLISLCEDLTQGRQPSLPARATLEDAVRLRNSMPSTTWDEASMVRLLDQSSFRRAERRGAPAGNTAAPTRGPVEVASFPRLVAAMKRVGVPGAAWEGYRFAATELPFASERRRAIQSALSVSLPTLCMSTWALVLGHYLNRDELTVCVLDHGRPRNLVGGEQTIGCFTQLVQTRAQIRRDEPLGEWCRRFGQHLESDLRRHRLTLDEGANDAWRRALREGRTLHLPVVNYQQPLELPGTKVPFFSERGVENVHGPGVLMLGFSHLNIMPRAETVSIFFDTLLGDAWASEVVCNYAAGLQAVADGASNVTDVLAALC